MKKIIMVALASVTMTAGLAKGAQVADWHDLAKTHQHIQEAIHEMSRARAANHYDMDGHGVKAEELLQQAERELDLAVQSAKTGR